jgi:hypothetical protein
MGGKRMSWKAVGIIFIILFLIETGFIVYIWKTGAQEIKNENLCLYEICGDYPQAYYANSLCTCYERDVLGQLQVAKTKVMN